MATKLKMTHTAIRKGRAYNRGRNYPTKIRFTKRHIVDEFGQKYNLITGTPTGACFEVYTIDIQSIKKIQESDN
jgi:hypothetical protein